MQEKEAVWQEIRNRVFQNMDLSGEISDKELKDDRGGSAAV